MLRNKKWLTRLYFVVGQTLLIAISVWMAFWADNYREERARLALRIELTASLQKDFSIENNEMAYVVKQINFKRYLIDSLLKILNTSPFSPEVSDIVIGCERPLYLAGVGEGSIVTLTTIVSSDNLNLFAQDSLFGEIMKYRSSRTYLTGQCEEINRKIASDLSIFINEKFSRSHPNRNATRLAEHEVRQLENILISIRGDLPSQAWLDQIQGEVRSLMSGLYRISN